MLKYSCDTYLASRDHTLEGYSTFLSAYQEVAYETLKQQWKAISDEACRLGHSMHYSIEMFYNDMYNPELPRFRTPAFLRFLRFHHEWVLKNDLVPYRTELCMFSERSELCGMIDILFQRRCDVGDPFLRHDVIMVDWKRSKEIKTEAFEKGDTFFPPLQMLPTCNLSDYTCQTSGYTVLLHEHTNIRVKERYIAVFHPNNESYQLFELRDVVDEMRICIDKRRAGKLVEVLEAKIRLRREAIGVLDDDNNANQLSRAKRVLREMLITDSKLTPLLRGEIDCAVKKARKETVPAMFRKKQ